MAPTSTLQDQMLHLFLYLGSEWILYLLIVLSIVSLAISAERLFYFVTHSADIEALQEKLNSLLNQGDVEGAKRLLATSKSPAAAIAIVGMDALGTGAASIEERISGASKVVKLKLERGLTFLGTLGNNAPFVGLFGTVLGIIRAFRDLSTNTIEGSSAVMAGIAEALVATAVGLLVALPAVAVFNTFQRRIRRELNMAEALTHTLLAFVKSQKS